MCEFVNSIKAQLLMSRPHLVARHELMLKSLMGAPRDLSTGWSQTFDLEPRIRSYSGLWGSQLAHGLADFLIAWTATRTQRGAIFLDNIDQADGLVQELVSVLMTRLDPTVFQLFLGVRAIPSFLNGLDTGTILAEPADISPSAGDSMAHQYVMMDGVADEPLLRSAYEATEPAQRAQWHDERADSLEATGDWSLRFGAIPYHREHGSDPAGAGVQAILEATEHCRKRGFYASAASFAIRGRTLTSPDEESDAWWTFTSTLAISLAMQDRAAEALTLYDEVRRSTVKPVFHMKAAYSTSMLYLRYLPSPDRDLQLARAWANAAVATASLLPDPAQRLSATIYFEQALSFLDFETGNPQEALLRIEKSLGALEEQPAPRMELQHRVRLLHIRARTLAVLGRKDQAISDLGSAISLEPGFPDYYFDRASLFLSLGRPHEAVADYTTIIGFGTPFPEVFYNRAEALLDCDESERALDDLDRALVLDPDYVWARVGRARLRYQLGQIGEAAADVHYGLAHDKDNAHLLGMLALIQAAEGDAASAELTLTRALAADETIPELWSNRAAIRFDMGEIELAITDLDMALALGDDPVIRYNRGRGLQNLNRFVEAVEDFTRALISAPFVSQEFAAELHYRRGQCRQALGDIAGSQEDHECFISLAPAES